MVSLVLRLFLAFESTSSDTKLNPVTSPMTCALKLLKWRSLMVQGQSTKALKVVQESRQTLHHLPLTMRLRLAQKRKRGCLLYSYCIAQLQNLSWFAEFSSSSPNTTMEEFFDILKCPIPSKMTPPKKCWTPDGIVSKLPHFMEMLECVVDSLKPSHDA